MKIYTSLDDTGMYQEKFRFRGTYLHGELETEMGYDIFCFEKELNLDIGKHYFIINNKPSTLFLWKGDEYMVSEWRGYLVYDDDTEYDWCKDRYEKQKQLI